MNWLRSSFSLLGVCSSVPESHKARESQLPRQDWKENGHAQHENVETTLFKVSLEAHFLQSCFSVGRRQTQEAYQPRFRLHVFGLKPMQFLQLYGLLA